MPNKELALALAGLMMVAPCGQTDEPMPSSRLQQRAAERGPIRTQLEAALAVPASAITAHAVEAAQREAHRASSSSTRSSIPVGVWVLIALGCLFACYIEFARGWSRL